MLKSLTFLRSSYPEFAHLEINPDSLTPWPPCTRLHNLTSGSQVRLPFLALIHSLPLWPTCVSLNPGFKGEKLEHANEQCWWGGMCNKKQGKCNYCGTEGFCCRQDWHDTSAGCDGTFGGIGMHQCVLKRKNFFKGHNRHYTSFYIYGHSSLNEE